MLLSARRMQLAIFSIISDRFVLHIYDFLEVNWDNTMGLLSLISLSRLWQVKIA
jgi:hypothetical protein